MLPRNGAYASRRRRKESDPPVAKKSTKSSATAKKPSKAAPRSAAKSANGSRRSKPAAGKHAAAKRPTAKLAPAKTAAVKPSVVKPSAMRNARRSTPVAPSAKPSKSASAVKTAATKASARQPATAIEPVAKPVKLRRGANAAGLNARDLQFYRQLLIDKMRELVGDVRSMETEALQASGGTNLSTLPVHMADMGTDNYEQEFTLGLVQNHRELLREIHHALKRIDNGTYGVCEGTGKPISRARLEAQPWTRFSIEHARAQEQRRRF